MNHSSKQEGVGYPDNIFLFLHKNTDNYVVVLIRSTLPRRS